MALGHQQRPHGGPTPTKAVAKGKEACAWALCGGRSLSTSLVGSMAASSADDHLTVDGDANVLGTRLRSM